MLNQLLRRSARLPEDHAPALIVIVDAEEEFDWNASFNRQNTETTSIEFQKQIHDRIFDRFSIAPTYVVDYPVATTARSVNVLRELMENHQCEIGAQLHPWVTPPHSELVSNHNSYAGNLELDLEFAKIKVLTEAIEENFGLKPIIYKAGRYGIGPNTSEILAKLGYEIDASIVPYTSYSSNAGPDFTTFTEQPFWFGDTDFPLLELPVTTGFCGKLRKYGPIIYPKLISAPLSWIHGAGFAARLGVLERIRITPEGVSAKEMARVATALVRSGCQILTMTYHSPSVVAGHTPYVRTQEDVKMFLQKIEEFCSFFQNELGGVFLSVSAVHKALTEERSPAKF